MPTQSSQLVIRPVRLTLLAVLLVTGTVLQKWFPMTRWGRLIGTPEKPDTASPPLAAKQLSPTAQELSKDISRACRLLPFAPSCLAQAFAGQRLLMARGTPGEVTIGLRRGSEGPWPAHAWLILDGQAITGTGMSDHFYPATTYRVRAHQEDSSQSGSRGET